MKNEKSARSFWFLQAEKNSPGNSRFFRFYQTVDILYTKSFKNHRNVNLKMSSRQAIRLNGGALSKRVLHAKEYAVLWIYACVRVYTCVASRITDNTTNSSFFFLFCFSFSFGQYSSGSTPLTGMEAGLLTTTTSSSMCITVIGSEVTGTSCLQHTNRKPA